MNEIYFKSVAELYQRLLLALKSKKKELHFHNFKYITELDIWNYLKETKWQNHQNLTLHDMVNDILYADNEVLDEKVRQSITNHYQ